MRQNWCSVGKASGPLSCDGWEPTLTTLCLTVSGRNSTLPGSSELGRATTRVGVDTVSAVVPYTSRISCQSYRERGSRIRLLSGTPFGTILSPGPDGDVTYDDHASLDLVCGEPVLGGQRFFFTRASENKLSGSSWDKR